MGVGGRIHDGEVTDGGGPDRDSIRWLRVQVLGLWDPKVCCDRSGHGELNFTGPLVIDTHASLASSGIGAS